MGNLAHTRSSGRGSRQSRRTCLHEIRQRDWSGAIWVEKAACLGGVFCRVWAPARHFARCMPVRLVHGHVVRRVESITWVAQKHHQARILSQLQSHGLHLSLADGLPVGGRSHNSVAIEVLAWQATSHQIVRRAIKSHELRCRLLHRRGWARVQATIPAKKRNASSVNEREHRWRGRS